MISAPATELEEGAASDGSNSLLAPSGWGQQVPASL